MYACMPACMRACVRMCVRAYVRACVYAYVRACACARPCACTSAFISYAVSPAPYPHSTIKFATNMLFILYYRVTLFNCRHHSIVDNLQLQTPFHLWAFINQSVRCTIDVKKEQYNAKRTIQCKKNNTMQKEQYNAKRTIQCKKNNTMQKEQYNAKRTIQCKKNNTILQY